MCRRTCNHLSKTKLNQHGLNTAIIKAPLSILIIYLCKHIHKLKHPKLGINMTCQETR